ncbi:unnamed protein product [Sphagnum tenellum]
MVILGVSAALVGLIHSLAPGHWLPVVLMAKSRRWSMRSAVLGATLVASGHIFLSTLLGLVSIYVELQYLAHYEEVIERYAGLGLGFFGLIYAAYAYFKHSGCQGHTHHGPNPEEGKKAVYAFLFSLGFSPCVAALPIFAAAAPLGAWSALVAFVCFSLGVLVALIGSTLLVSQGLVKLDHPLFEHYGDVITGLCVALMGPLTKLMSKSSFALKGSGWYTTDYKRSAAPTEPQAKGSDSASKSASGDLAKASDLAGSPSTQPPSESAMDQSQALLPTHLEPLSPIELHIRWNNGENYALPYSEIRYYCPCAGCIDEHTGERTIQKSSIDPAIRPIGVHPIGRYAIQFNWSDGHSTGMYHFDRLMELCQKQGRSLPQS